MQRTRATVGRRVRSVAALVVPALVLAACAGSNDKQQNGLRPDGKVARDDYHLLMPFFWLGIAIGVAIVLATLYAAVRYRYRPGKNENPRQVEGNTVLEIGWTILPALILLVMAVFTVRLIWQQAEKPKNALAVTVVGKQWWWEFEYTNYGSHQRLFTANELHLPEGRPVYFSYKSDNVIHSFWIPNLAGKKDVMPGRINHNWLIADKGKAKPGKPAVYYGQCAEYCGLSHADMRAKAFVQTQDDFDAWYKSQLTGWSASDAKTFDGKWNATYACTSCHYIQGMDATIDKEAASGARDVPPGKPAYFPPQITAIGPNLTHLGDRTTFGGAKYDLTLDNLTNWIWDAPSDPNQAGEFGKPNQCTHRASNGATGAGTSCKVGMPSFKDDPKSPMSKATAREIAQFILCAGTTDADRRQQWGCS